MTHEYRGGGVGGFDGGGDVSGQGFTEKEVRGEAEDAGEWVGGGKASEDGDGAALGEATWKDINKEVDWDVQKEGKGEMYRERCVRKECPCRSRL